jgi:hypothetical protein
MSKKRVEATVEEKFQSLMEYCKVMQNLGEQHPEMIEQCGEILYSKLMVEKGQRFVGFKKSDLYPDAKEWRQIMRPKPKQCFYNAQLFVVDQDGPERYFEGYVYNYIPTMHAWCVMPDGNVVDFTLEAANRSLKRDKITPGTPESVVYLGVEVPTDFIRSWIVSKKMTEPIAHIYHLGSKRRFLL